ncbi:hypothetical protein OBBRIDRAFT_781390 [Obba rivulosa]|uniref:Transmembrane protein 188 n=1 Tax=Obba rivulosa TaxID=1052685 RepID=A0A8E2ANQ7_9APHY|nr:hypothetical protein OBBRIDRAFT_781390 [Obba rivulosa]
MPSRSSSKLQPGSFCPPNDAYTHRDLLLFEERLKSNAASLKRRKRRYQLFLVQLLLAIVFLLSEVLLQTDFLSIPYRLALKTALPHIYTDDTDVRLHPYIPSALLFVSVTTFVLFFATGTYSEKIGYANRYVPHANRALRSFNMYLNVRQPPLRSKLPFKTLAMLFARPDTDVQPPHRASSPSRDSARRSSSVPISPIPPASNPRGELIFSSRVDRGFRESYERYRSAFERRREMRDRATYANTWIGWFLLKLPRMKKPTSALPSTGSTAGPGGSISRPSSGASHVSKSERTSPRRTDP